MKFEVENFAEDVKEREREGGRKEGRSTREEVRKIYVCLFALI